MEFAVRYEDPLMEVGGLKADSVLSKTCTWVEMKSMGQEVDENKMPFKNNGSLPFNSRKGVVSSTDIAKLCDNGDATSEVLEANIVNKCKNSLKRLPNEIYEEYIVSLDLKRYKNGLPRSPDGEFVNIVADSEGGNMRDDAVMLDPEVFAEEALLAREAICLKRHENMVTEPPNWQKIRKMHPMMYANHFGTSYKFRDRIRSKARPSPVKGLSLGQAGSESFSSGTRCNLETSLSPHMARTDGHGNGNVTYDSSTADSLFCMHVLQKVLVGLQFQAKVPEWDGVISGSDSKWLGTRMWPLEKKEHWSLIERDPIGKGRHHSCGCQLQGSVDCLRFRIAEKRMKLKLELGSAFHHMKLDKTGEEVELSWADKEHNRFAAIVQSNPQSQDKCFWEQMFKVFRSKSREELVSYYFNVFLLKRRAHQNSFMRDNIDSDDDECRTSLAVKRASSHRKSSPQLDLLFSKKAKCKIWVGTWCKM